MDIFDIDHATVKQTALHGRYITRNHIVGILSKLPTTFKCEKLGSSVEGVPIESLTFGKGSHRIFMWSQMHGNESTTTKAVFDLINLLQTNTNWTNSVLEKCTIRIIPMLNPDGAKAYTRVNANNVDLNRDARHRSQPESVVLRECYADFKPDFCFNLHDQRTIFNVGKTAKPATVSFLAPAHDDERSVSATRAISMQLIAAMNDKLQERIPGQVGRYDDTFNPNCIGDTFQMLGTPTVLFESGHYPGDYQRETTRKYIFYALLTALETITSETWTAFKKAAYHNIPENGKLFYDILVRNAHKLNPDTYAQKESVGILYKEVLSKDTIEFQPSIEKIDELKGCYGHKTYDCLDGTDLEALKKSSFSGLL